MPSKTFVHEIYLYLIGYLDGKNIKMRMMSKDKQSDSNIS